jgi:retinol dehydrogenase 12
MTIFNIFAPAFARVYWHPRFSSADDIIPDLTGKVAIVTGGTGGLGLETALQLAKKGAKVYIAGRSQVKGQAAVEKIRAVTGASEEQVQFLELNLADIKETKSAAEKFLETSQPLNILVNNAGFLAFKFSLTARDKLESHIAG